eukprot:6188290-Pleurochrysis_carterae.AAC.2
MRPNEVDLHVNYRLQNQAAFARHSEFGIRCIPDRICDKQSACLLSSMSACVMFAHSRDNTLYGLNWGCTVYF